MIGKRQGIPFSCMNECDSFMRDGSRPWGRAFVLLFGVALMIIGNGCASSRAREKNEYYWAPRPYPAVRMNFGDPELPVDMHGDKFDLSPIGHFISCVILPVDLPISCVTDTVLLPMDLYRWREDIVNKQYVANALYSAKMPSADEFKKQYIPKYGSVVVLGYLHQPPGRISQERLDMLLAAGVDGSTLARSHRLDEDFADRLIDWILTEYDPTNTLLLLAENKNISASTLRRLAGLNCNSVCTSVASHKRTPPDVLYKLTDVVQCIEPLVNNTNTPPEVLLKLTTKAIPGRYLRDIVRHPNATPEVFLAVLSATNAFPYWLTPISKHPNATPEVLKVYFETFSRILTNNPPPSLDLFERCDRALKALARREQLPPELLPLLATQPFPWMLNQLADRQDATTNIWATIMTTCRQAAPPEAERGAFAYTRTNVRRKLGLPIPMDELLAQLPTANQNTLRDITLESSITPEALLAIARSTNSYPAVLFSIAEHRNAMPEIYRAVAAVCIPALTNAALATEQRQGYEQVLSTMIQRGNCAPDVLLTLAIIPSPSILAGVVNSPQATSNILATALATCQAAQARQGAVTEYDTTFSIARRRLGLPISAEENERKRAFLERCVSRLPTHSSYFLEELVYLDLSENRRAEAEAHLQKWLAIDSRSLKANKMMGGIELERKRYARAAACFRVAVEVDRSPENLNNLAWALQMQGNYDQALALSRESVQADPNSYSSRDTLGVILMKCGRLKEAEKELAAAWQLNPDAPEPRLHLAQLWVRQGVSREYLVEWGRDLESRAPELSPADQKELSELLEHLQPARK